MKTLIFCVFLLLPFLIFAQTDPLANDSVKVEIEYIFDRVDEGASPLEGIEAFNKNIMSRMKVPSEAKKINLEGKVFIQFIVDEEGNLTEFTVVKGIGAGWDEETLYVFRTYDKKWKAGKFRGKNVKQRIVVPVQCKIR